MSLKDNAYDQGADDALKNLIDEGEALLASVEEEDTDGEQVDWCDGVRDMLKLVKDMRQSLYT